MVIPEQRKLVVIPEPTKKMDSNSRTNKENVEIEIALIPIC